MKWVEKAVGTKQDLLGYLTSICEQFGTNSLAVEGHPVDLPDGEIEFKIKFEEEEEGGKLSIKASWVNWGYEEPEDEEEDTEE